MTQPESNESISQDTIVSLSFDYLKQIATLSLASAGGTITLLQTSLIDPNARLFGYAAGALFFLAAIFALQAQQILVERLRSGSMHYSDGPASKVKISRTWKSEQRITMASFVMFGIGVGVLVGSLLIN